MAKLPAIWAAQDGSSVATQTSGDVLLESGDILLLEDNASFLLLEDVSMAIKEDTSWLDSPTKYASRWASDGATTYNMSSSGVQRIQQDSVTVRTLQDGTIRLLQENTAVPKSVTRWDDL